MKKFLFLLLLPAMASADRLGSLRSSADVLLTTQAVAGSGSGIVSPGTFTWTDTFGMSLSTLTATTSITAASETVTTNLYVGANVSNTEGIYINHGDVGGSGDAIAINLALPAFASSNTGAITFNGNYAIASNGVAQIQAFNDRKASTTGSHKLRLLMGFGAGILGAPYGMTLAGGGGTNSGSYGAVGINNDTPVGSLDISDDPAAFSNYTANFIRLKKSHATRHNLGNFLSAQDSSGTEQFGVGVDGGIHITSGVALGTDYGTSAQVLTSAGRGFVPTWSTPSAVVQSSAVPFGSATNVIAVDSNSFTWNNTSKSLSVSGGGVSGITISTTVAQTNMRKAGFIVVKQHYAFVTANQSNSLTIFDVANSTSPVMIKQITNGYLYGAEGLEYDGDTLYVVSLSSNAVIAFDISSPASTTQIGVLQDAVNLHGAEHIRIVGKYLLIANFNHGAGEPAITVVDKSNPAAMTVVGSLNNDTFVNPIDIVIRYPYAYLLSNSASSCPILTLGISNLPTITQVASFSPTGCSQQLAGADYYGKYLYAASNNGSAGAFFVVDISSPAAPVSISSQTTGSFVPLTLRVVGNDLFFTSLITSSIVQYSLTNPAAPSLRNSITDTVLLSNADDLYPSGSNLYVSLQGSAGFPEGGFAIINPGSLNVTAMNAGSLLADELEVTHDIRVPRIFASGMVNAPLIAADHISSRFDVKAGSMTGAGLSTCGDATHALGYTSGTGLFSCQSVTGSGGGGGSSPMAVGLGSVSGYTTLLSSPTPGVIFDSNTFTGSLNGGGTTYLALTSSVTKQGVISAASLGALTANQSITLSGDSTGSGTTAITVSAAANQPNIITLAGSSTTVVGILKTTATYVSSASVTTDEYSNGAYVAISTIAWANGNMQKLTLTANTTINFTAPTNPSTLTLRLLTGAGSFTVAWPGTVKWSGGTAPTITTTASKNDFVICKYASDGSYYCSATGTQNF